MYSLKIKQLLSYLESHDNHLALRRMLDLVRETDSLPLLKKSVELCQRLRCYDLETSEGRENYKSRFKEFIGETEKNLSSIINTKEVKPLLKAEAISKRYRRSNFLLDSVSLELNMGEVIGVVGENGNGKTTLLQCIAGYLSIDSGALYYYFLENETYAAIKEHVAFIPQRIPKWYGSLKENLHFSASASGLKGKENDVIVEFMVERMGLSAFANHTWEELSSGYRTRFELARILLTQPSLLVLDEPLANLDIIAQQTLLADLKYLCESERHPLGIILSSQQLFEVEKAADKIVLLKQGAQININEKKDADEKCVIELEITNTKEELTQIFSENKIEVSYDGSYYTIISMDLTLQEILKKLIHHDIDIHYYRDITQSTKRFF